MILDGWGVCIWVTGWKGHTKDHNDRTKGSQSTSEEENPAAQIMKYQPLPHQESFRALSKKSGKISGGESGGYKSGDHMYRFI